MWKPHFPSAYLCSECSLLVLHALHVYHGVKIRGGEKSVSHLGDTGAITRICLSSSCLSVCFPGGQLSEIHRLDFHKKHLGDSNPLCRRQTLVKSFEARANTPTCLHWPGWGVGWLQGVGDHTGSTEICPDLHTLVGFFFFFAHVLLHRL